MGNLLCCNLYFIVHTVCYCMDVIRLNGNVWIKCLYAQGKMMCGITARCERAV
jgi:hypothetical protein